ncbi:MAG: general secretion pathway protein GspK [Pirellulales bacterium]|nr:general secretion pathway protein GspK [Pirellulales bacterium]
MSHCTHPSRKASPGGSILLLVLVAIMIMSLTTSSYLLLMQNEHRATRNSGKHLQAEFLTQTGVAYLRELLVETPDTIQRQGGLLNNPNLLQAVLVADDQFDIDRGRFTVLAPDMEQGNYLDVRYGLEDESAKLNLNALVADDDETQNTARERLLALPGMEAAIADAILDWIDQDGEPREFGAEDDYYQGQQPAYSPRNGPLTSLDELLMVRGVTAELLYGLDLNRNYLVDEQEEPRGSLLELDNSLGQLNRGWSAYLTTQSLEKLVDANDAKKIDVNAPDLKQLHNQLTQTLGEEAANFIIACRQYGWSAGGENQGSSASFSGKIDFDKQASTNIDSLLSLVGARVSIEAQENGPQQTLDSPWQNNANDYRQGFAELLDSVKVGGNIRLAGRINIQQASRTVLLSIPGMTESIADQILTLRNPEVQPLQGQQRHAVWLLAEGIVTLEEMKPLWPYITTRGDVYSGQIVGFFDAGATQLRTQVVLDRSGKNVRLVGWEDLSNLGPGFTPTMLGAQPANQDESPQLVP